jgi:putative ATPase
LAEAVIYLACCEKNNSVNIALEASKKLAGKTLNADSPLHLKNSEKGQQLYKYPHNFPGGWVEQQYLPSGLENSQIYVPKDIGYEKILSNYLNWLKARVKEQKE